MKNSNIYLFIILLVVTSNLYSQERTFKNGQTYIYATEYKDLANDLIIYDTINLVITDKPWRGAPEKQKEMIWLYAISQDSATFSNMYTLGIVRSDTTGYIENDTRLFLHPPRHQHYTIIELAPFPEIDLPLEKGKEYQRLLFTSTGWGEFSQLKIKNKYLIKGSRKRQWNNESISVWDIQSESQSELGITTADFVFNHTRGFMKIEYRFYNNIEINIKLIEINE